MDSGFFSGDNTLFCWYYGAKLEYPANKKRRKKRMIAKEISVEGGQMGLHDEGECVLLRASIAKGHAWLW